MPTSTWETREFPILEAVAELEEVERQLSNEHVAGRTGLSGHEVQLGLRALYESGYITGIDAAAEELCYLIGIRLLERGRRAVGVWPPDDAFAVMLDVVDERLSETTDEETRTRLQRFREDLYGMGKVAAGGLITEVLKRSAGL